MLDSIEKLIQWIFGVFLNIAVVPVLVLLIIVIIYPFSRLYWLRVLGVGFLLSIWGIMTAIMPLYVVWKNFNEGGVIVTFFTLLAGIGTALPFIFAAKFAREWVKEEIAFGRWTKMPWNA
jgi:hypothetical protein